MKKFISGALSVIGAAAFCYVAASALVGMAQAQGTGALNCERYAEYALEVGRYRDQGLDEAQARAEAATVGISTDGALAYIYAESAARYLYSPNVRGKPLAAAVMVLRHSCDKVIN